MKSLIRVLTACACLTLGSAWAQLTFVPQSETGFTTQTFTHADLKTVDLNTVTLGNASGVTATSTLGSGGAYTATATASPPTGFAGNYLQVTSGTNVNGSKAVLTFAGGTSYVSFLWNLQTGDSDNTVKFNLSNGTSVSVSNCSAATTTCVGGYDTFGFFDALFSWLFGSNGLGSTQSARLVYKPAAGVTVTSVELTAKPYYSCTLIIFCAYNSRTFKADAISYVDNSASLPAGLHHLEILSDTSNTVTCQNSAFRVRACANASCSSLYTSGVTGNLTANGSTKASFSIPAGSSVSGDMSFKLSSAATYTMAASSVSPSPSATGYCGLGASVSNASGACSYKTQGTALLLGLPSHRAGTTQNMQISLVKDLLGSCVSVAAGKLLSFNLTPTYAGSTAPKVGGTSLVNGVGSTLGLTLNTLGLVNTDFVYDNVGPVQLKVEILSNLTASLLGLTGLTNSVLTAVAPASFKVEKVDADKASAGNPIAIRLSALTGGSTPLVATNFSTAGLGLGPISISHVVSKPTSRQSGAPNNPALTVSDVAFVNGVATVNVTWGEVGTIDLTALLPEFLGKTALSVTGALTGLTIVPDRFAVSAPAKCGAFTYMGQPFDVTVSALNAAGEITKNYDGKTSSVVSKAVSLNPSGVASTVFGSSPTIAANAFGDGTATGSLTYVLGTTLTAPTSVAVGATDADVADSTPANMNFRRGRLRLSNAYGSEKAALSVPIQLQYWNGKNWVPTSDDSCTTAAKLPLTSLVPGAFRSQKGAVMSALNTATQSVSLSNGIGKMVMSAPGAKNTGTTEVSIDLDSAAVNMPWLKPLCGSALCNPKATVSFGVFSPETQKAVNVQDAY